MKKLVFLIFIILAAITFSEKKVIKVGIVNDKFTDFQVGEKNFNDIIKEMLEKEMGYSLDITSGNWSDINEKFSKGDIELIFPVERSYKGKTSAQFSENMYPQTFYIASDRYDVRDIANLRGRKIYTLKGAGYSAFLEKILKDGMVKAEIIEVEDIENYRNEITAQPSSYIQDMEYTHKIGVLPFAVIGYKGVKKNFISEVNNALNSKYRKILTNHKDDVEKNMRIQRFMNSLSEDEKKFVKDFKVLNIAYEENSIVSHYVPEKKSYRGLIPLILQEMSEHLDLKINIVNKPYEQWESLLKRFEEKETHIISMVKTEEREKNYLFSDKIYDIDVYKISANNHIATENSKQIGVIKDSIEDLLARKYYKEEEIWRFNDLDGMKTALKENQLASALNFDQKLVSGPTYSVEKFYSVPMNFALHKEDTLLKGVMSKAYRYMVDKDVLMENFVANERAFFQERIAKEMSLHSIWYKRSLAFLLVFFVLLGVYFNKRQKASMLEKLAFIDSLSGLKNRYSFDKACEDVNSQEGAAIVVDLDNFKRANDIHGHDLGDKIIQHCATLFMKAFGKENVYRISGDEYYIFISKEKYEERINEMKEAADSSEFLKRYSVYCSIGYFLKEKNLDTKTAFKYADMAMYQAKTVKGNSIFGGSDKFVEKLKKSNFIRENIESSIEKEFYPVFQPKVSIENPEKIVGAEALARWYSPVLGQIFPDEFIPVAETMKIIKEIDFKIAEDSIKALSRWIEQGTVEKDFQMSFNLSVYTLETEDVPAKIQEFLAKYGVSPRNIEIEITESVISKKPTETIAKLNKLKSLGIYLALDDFTAGHSTAGVLPILPVDMIKLDRSLLLSMNNEKEKGTMIYTSLIELIKNMGFAITAEGIEYEHDYDFMKENGVKCGQGYFFGKPVKEDEFLEKMAQA